MSLKVFWKYLASFFLLFAIFSVSCRKNENTSIDYNPAVTASNEFAYNQLMMTQILGTYFKSLSDSILWADGHAEIDGAIVSIQNSPDVRMEIFYPMQANNGELEQLIQGLIEAIPETDFTQFDGLVNFNFIDFYFDKDTLEVKEMTVQQITGGTQITSAYEVNIDSAIIIYSDSSGRKSFNINQIFQLNNEPSTVHASPFDKILIAGTMNGITVDLLTYSAEVPNSFEIINSIDCSWFTNGKSIVQVDDFEYLATVYFPENDSCMNEYFIEVDGNSFPFSFDY